MAAPLNRSCSPDVTKVGHAPITAEATARSKDVQKGLVCAKGGVKPARLLPLDRAAWDNTDTPVPRGRGGECGCLDLRENPIGSCKC